jgi:hypothetical protein
MNRGNNKITELRTILQRESQNAYVYKHKISQQPENCENRNDPDLVRQTSRFHYGSTFPAVTITIFITILEQNR